MAIEVGKEMLRGDYDWSAVEHGGSRGRARELALFHRGEGHEVHAMVQQVANHFGYSTVHEVQAVEAAIREALPRNLRSWSKVLAWLIRYLSGR
jgi:hypothetical protein